MMSVSGTNEQLSILCWEGYHLEDILAPFRACAGVRTRAQTLISDAHTTETLQLGGGRNIKAEDVIDELNTVMRWISFPGRTSNVAPSDQIDFSQI